MGDIVIHSDNEHDMSEISGDFPGHPPPRNDFLYWKGLMVDRMCGRGLMVDRNTINYRVAIFYVKEIHIFI